MDPPASLLKQTEGKWKTDQRENF